jgi:hypothetical protein
VYDHKDAFYPKLRELIGESEIATEFIAYWGLDKERVFKIVKTSSRDKPWIVRTMWPYRDRTMAKYALDCLNEEWYDREQIIVWAAGVALYPMLDQWRGRGQSREEIEDEPRRRTQQWREWMDLFEDLDPQELKEGQLQRSREILGAFVVWATNYLKGAKEMEEGDLPPEEIDRPYDDEIAAVNTLVYQMDSSSVPLLERVRKLLTDISQTKFDRWDDDKTNEDDVAEMVDESIRRLKSPNPLLPPVQEVPQIRVRKGSLSDWIEEVRAAILKDKPPNEGLAWHCVVGHGNPTAVYADLPLSVVRHLESDKDETIRDFAKFHLAWEWRGVK